MPTKQELYDTVLFALRKQGRASVVPVGNTFICRYRGNDGAKCAAGHLLGDEFFTADRRVELEGLRFSSLPKSILKSVVGKNSPDAMDKIILIETMQKIHDHKLTKSLKAWEKAMRMLADIHQLTYTKPNNKLLHSGP